MHNEQSYKLSFFANLLNCYKTTPLLINNIYFRKFSFITL